MRLNPGAKAFAPKASGMEETREKKRERERGKKLFLIFWTEVLKLENRRSVFYGNVCRKENLLLSY